MSTRQFRHQTLLAPLVVLSLTLAPLVWAEDVAPTSLPNEEELLPEPASGIPTEAAASAREFGIRGLVAYSAGDFGAALEHFGRAEELAHSPVFRLYLARSLAGLGRTEEARAVYQSILDEVPIVDASTGGSGGQTSEATTSAVPAPWVRARGEANRELEALPPTTPTPAAETPKPTNVEPVEPTQKPAPTTTPEPHPASSHQGLGPERWAAVSAFAVGGAGLVTAVVTGSVALSLAAEVRNNCVDSVCPIEDRPKADRATALGNVATAAIVVAAVGTLTGVTLLALAPPRKSQPTVALEARGPSLVLRGRF